MSDEEVRTPKRRRGANNVGVGVDIPEDNINQSPLVVYDPEAERRRIRLLGTKQDDQEIQKILDEYTPDQWQNLADTLLQSHLDQASSEDEVMNTFSLFYQLFCHRYRSVEEVQKRMKHLYPDVHILEERKKKVMSVYSMIHFQLLARQMINEEDRTGAELFFKLKAISFQIKTSFEIMVTLHMMMNSSDTLMRAKLADMTPQLIFREVDPLKVKKHHQVFTFYCRKAFAAGYRKEEDRIYAPIFNEHRRFVCAYKYTCTIKEFVFNAVYPLEHNEYLFSCLIDNPQTPKNCINFLTHFKNESLPELKRDPGVFAFRNGLFVISHVKFYHFEKVEGRFWAGDLDASIIATVYHDIMFDEDGMDQDMEGQVDALGCKHYMAVVMPEIYKFLTDQGYTVEEIRWIFCFLGRLLFRVGEFDSWGVFIYFIGLAGTGKGTLLRLVMSLMDKRDVGILNNELQKTFALDGTENKRVILGLDIDESFKMDKATLLSMSVGEEVSIIQKFKQPTTVEWFSHIGFAGNTFPRWEDRGGNLARRFFLVECTKPIKNVDTSLFKKAKEKRDRFLFVIVSAYMEIATCYKDKGIKEHLPEKFKIAERKAMQELNALLQFVTDHCDVEEIEDENNDRTYVQPFSEFNRAFGDFCVAQGMSKKTLTNNYMSGVFGRFQVSVIDQPGRSDKYGQKAKYLLGLKLKNDIAIS